MSKLLETVIVRTDGKLECSDCHAYFNNGADYCPCCGRRLTEEPETTVLQTTILPVRPSAPYLLKMSTDETIQINRAYFRIGKNERQCDYVSDNPYVSNIHIDLITANGHFYVYDLISKNGTYVNDRQIPPKQEIEVFNGDIITLGKEKYKLVAE